VVQDILIATPYWQAGLFVCLTGSAMPQLLLLKYTLCFATNQLMLASYTKTTCMPNTDWHILIKSAVNLDAQKAKQHDRPRKQQAKTVAVCHTP
jgi:hypothetical protein